jgi:hypothetical protein
VSDREQSETGQVAVIRTAQPAENLEAVSYNKEQNKLMLCVS